MIYIQRIYDTVLTQYVYYNLAAITTAPTIMQTSPNHTGVFNLVVSSHAVIATIGEGELSVLDDGVLLTPTAASIDFTGGSVSSIGDAVTVAAGGGGGGTSIDTSVSTTNATPTVIYSYTPTAAGRSINFQFQVVGTGIGYKSHFVISALASTNVSSVVTIWDVYYLNGPYTDSTMFVDITSTNPVNIRVTGIAATNLDWKITGSVVEHTVAGGGDP